MAKKKNNKQKQQQDASVADTSEEELIESNLQGKCCSHVPRGVNFGRVKRTLKSTQDISTCSGCSNSSAEEQEVPEEVWLCLQCGYRGCGRISTSKHGLQHFKTIHSDCHALVLSSTTGIVWCYECDDEVQLQNSNRHLRQCVDYIMRLKGNSKPKAGVREEKPEKLAPKRSLIESVIKDQITVKKELSKEMTKNENAKNNKNSVLPKHPVKGLRNLGNTCFFNSVMQNLSQTLLLYKELDESCSKDYRLEVPQLRVVDGSVIEDTTVENLHISLAKQSSLVNSLLNFLNQMSTCFSNKVEIINPATLFGEISIKSPQFRHFQQQDSHELLRQLLDGVRQDEVKRQKFGILRHFNVNKLKEVDDDLRKIIKVYGSYASYTIVEKIFGGLLISTVSCEECKKSSQVFEPFMDISLPLFEEKPIRNCKSEQENDKDEEFSFQHSKKDYSKPSKHQERKLKELAKKEKKRNKKLQGKKCELYEASENQQNDNDGTPPITEELPNGLSAETGGADDEIENEDTPAELRAEKITQEESKQTLNEEDTQITAINQKESCMTNGHLIQSPKTNSKFESSSLICENSIDHRSSKLVVPPSIHVDPESEENSKENSLEIMQMNRGTPTFNVFKKSSTSGSEDALSNEDKDIKETSTANISSPDHRKTTPVDNSHHATPLSNMDMSSLCEELRKIIEETKRDEKRRLFHSSSGSVEDSESEKEDTWSQTLSVGNTEEWVTKSLMTLSPRNQVLPMECSIDSCLTHFTKPELLTGSNKFRCENCTEIKCKKTGNKKDMAYTNASKQLLIFSPPAILTLHLKRFQQVGMSLRKVNRYVEFPLILDLAPYCSSASLMLPHMSSVKDKVLYSLYGIVEHSGRLTSGHYTAFVKVSKRTLNQTFVNRLPLGQWDLEQLLEKFSKLTTAQTAEEEETESENNSRWYYISDSHVSESSQDQVMKCQAYLLFYERIK